MQQDLQHTIKEKQMRDVEKSLSEGVGVKPSHEWLDACSSYLQENGYDDTIDSILFQILNADICDVVRPVRGNDGQPRSPSQRIRIAIKASQTKKTRSQAQPMDVESTNPKGGNEGTNLSMVESLDDKFRLMCQVEEVVDVSLNAEARLAAVTTSTSDPTTSGNRVRCLKLCLNDGYDSQPIIAIEESTIPNLSVNAKAGLKVVLHGPLKVRWGMLMLNSGNSLILGGSVQALVERQQKALTVAKQRAGVGCDPTIRALIGTAPLEPEEEQDEGEGESGDIVAPPPAPTPRSQPQPSVQIPRAPSQPNPSMPPPPAIHNPIPNSTAASSLLQNSTVRTANSMVATPSNQMVSRNYSSTYNPYSNATPAPAPVPASTLLRRNLPNPYAVNEVNGTRSAGSSSTRNSYPRLTRGSNNPQSYKPSPSNSNPYSKNRTDPMDIESNDASMLRTPSSFVTASTIMDATLFASSSNEQPSKIGSSMSSVDVSNATGGLSPIVDLTGATASPLHGSRPAKKNTVHRHSGPTSSSSQVTKTPTAPATQPIPRGTLASNFTTPQLQGNNLSQASSSAMGEERTTQANVCATPRSLTAGPGSAEELSSVPSQNMSFENLRALLLQVLTNEEMYKSYYGLTFAVQLVQTGPLLVFDTQKRKDWRRIRGMKDKQNESDKYEFVMVTKFAGLTSNETITCKIASSLLEQFFQLPAGEVRKLSRTDRARSNKVTDEGGDLIRGRLFTPGTWKATFAHSPHDLFPPRRPPAPCPVDGQKIPVLLLLHHEAIPH